MQARESGTVRGPGIGLNGADNQVDQAIKFDLTGRFAPSFEDGLAPRSLDALLRERGDGSGNEAAQQGLPTFAQSGFFFPGNLHSLGFRQQPRVDSVRAGLVVEGDAGCGADRGFAAATGEELVNGGEGRLEQLQERLLDHRHAHFGADGLALRVGSGDDDFDLFARTIRAFGVALAAQLQLHSQVALHGEGAVGLVEADDLLWRGFLWIGQLRGLTPLGSPGICHHHHGKLKVRRQPGGHWNRQVVRAGL